MLNLSSDSMRIQQMRDPRWSNVSCIVSHNPIQWGSNCSGVYSRTAVYINDIQPVSSKWVCGYCTHTNEDNMLKCHVCGGLRFEELKNV